MMEGCQESFQGDYPASKSGEGIEDKEGELSIKSTVSRVWRGGSFYNLASSVRSAIRDRSAPTGRYDNIGFRPARTFTP
jgi:formylglycine-generating enzyme required for sulfatase activity